MSDRGALGYPQVRLATRLRSFATVGLDPGNAKTGKRR